MKVFEKFKKGQEVFVLSQNGLLKGEYVRLNTPNSYDIDKLVGYRDKYGTAHTYAEIEANRVFSSVEAAKRYLLYGVREELPTVATHESKFDIDDAVYDVHGDKGIRQLRVESVRWRLGEWEYHTNAGGCAYYLERGEYFATREEAVEAYLNR